MTIINKLPLEIVDLFRGYKGGLKLRNGKYMRQIPKNDPRYEIFNNTLLFIVSKEHINRGNRKLINIPQYTKMIFIHPITKREISVRPFFSLIPQSWNTNKPEKWNIYN